MIDAWTGQAPQSTEFPRVENDGIRRLVQEFKKVATSTKESTTGLLRSAGITLTETLMTLANSLRVEGTLTSTGEATFGGDTNVTGSLTTTGTANIGGTMNVTGDAVFSGDLAVPNGSITNAALESPVTGDAGNAAQTTSITTTANDYASVSIAVPSGFTRANVLAVSAISTPASQTDQMSTVIAGAAGPQMIIFGGQGASSYARQLTGLSGGSIVVASRVNNALGSGAGARVITTSATVTFLR